MLSDFAKADADWLDDLLRGISDGAEDLAHVGDWTRYLHIIDTKLAVAVDHLRDALSSGAMRL